MADRLLGAAPLVALLVVATKPELDEVAFPCMGDLTRLELFDVGLGSSAVVVLAEGQEQGACTLAPCFGILAASVELL